MDLLKNSAPSRRNFGREKGKQMDRLSRESCEALAMGMTYGQYKAWQKERGLGEPANPRSPLFINPEEKLELVCEVCGQKFKTKTKHRKYCSAECKGKVDRDRQREKRQQPTDLAAPRICEACGKEITNRPGARKFCSVQCCRRASGSTYRKRQKEDQEYEWTE